MTRPVHTWYVAERETLKTSNRGGVLLGGIVYGPTFLRIFRDYCLPTLLAAANRAALKAHGAQLALYTDSATHDDLLLALHNTGIDDVVRIIPDAVIDDHALFWARISAAMGLLVQRAARNAMAFHMLMPDQGYSENYFPGLFGLSKRHPKIAHNGLNAKMTASAELDGYRLTDGSLPIPARDLGDIAWRNLHWRMNSFIMNGAPSDRLPNCHYQLWHCRDRAMMFSPYNNTAYMDAETCKALDSDAPPVATLDLQIHRLFGLDYYVPGLDDDMTFIGLEWSGAPAEQTVVHVDRETFLKRCRADTGHNPDNLIHFTKPTEIALSIDEGAPTAEEIWARQCALVNEMRAAA